MLRVWKRLLLIAFAVVLSAGLSHAAPQRALKGDLKSSTIIRKPLDPALLNRGRLQVVPAGITLDQYLTKMRGQWRNKDWNQDMVVSWQGSAPTENLAAQASCVIVDYQHQAAKKEKDKSKPGQYVETPEAWVPVDWRPFLDVLAATKFQGGECQAVGTVDVKQCVIGDKAYTTWDAAEKHGLPPNTGRGMCPNPYFDNICKLLSSWNQLGLGPSCAKSPTNPSCVSALVQVCAAKGGVIQDKTKMKGCEKWQTFGPDTEEAFLRVATANFKAEDLNANGRIDKNEGQYLCSKP